MTPSIRLPVLCLISLAILCFFSPSVTAKNLSVTVGVYENKPKVFTAEDGKPSGIFVDIIEHIAKIEGWELRISEGMEAHKALEASEHKYRELVEHANSIILRWTHEGVITFLNEFGLRFFGYTADEIIGRHVMGTIVPAADSDGNELLYTSDDFSKINFHHFADQVMENLVKSYDLEESKINFKVDGDQMSLGIDLAVPCGLIVNELLSNKLMGN